MKGHDSRRDLLSFLTASGISPEAFLEALDILKEDIRAALLPNEGERPGAPPAMPGGTAEEEVISRILEGIAARWALEEETAREQPPAPAAPAGDPLLQTVVKPGGAPRPPPCEPAAPAVPPAAPSPESPRVGAAPPAQGREVGKITTETVILKAPSASPGPPSPSRPHAPPPADQPTTILRIGQPPPPTPPGTKAAGEDDLLRTVVKPPKGGPFTPPPDDRPTTILRTGPGEEQSQSPPATGEDDLSKTVILTPEQLKRKGKGESR